MREKHFHGDDCSISFIGMIPCYPMLEVAIRLKKCWLLYQWWSIMALIKSWSIWPRLLFSERFGIKYSNVMIIIISHNLKVGSLMNTILIHRKSGRKNLKGFYYTGSWVNPTFYLFFQSKSRPWFCERANGDAARAADCMDEGATAFAIQPARAFAFAAATGGNA